jgi:hypothetical protein
MSVGSHVLWWWCVFVADTTKNRLVESVKLFEALTGLPWFRDKPLILFLNKGMRYPLIYTITYQSTNVCDSTASHARCGVLCCAPLCCAVLCCAVLCCAVNSRHIPSQVRAH